MFIHLGLIQILICNFQASHFAKNNTGIRLVQRSLNWPLRKIAVLVKRESWHLRMFLLLRYLGLLVVSTMPIPSHWIVPM